MLCGSRNVILYAYPFGRFLSYRPFKPVETSSASNELGTDFIPQCDDRHLAFRVACTAGKEARKAWIETLRSNETNFPVGLMDLHPDIFAAFPRMDLVYRNLYWQAHYRLVDWRCITSRAELPYRSNRKPWPQKGTGRARHGNRRTHIWLGGAQCKGPRGPESFFSILPRDVRIAGLLSMLSIKHAQDDLHIVDNMQLSSDMERESEELIQLAIETVPDESAEDDPLSAAHKVRSHRLTKVMNNTATYLRQLVDQRKWGPSVLFVTSDTIAPSPEASVEGSLSKLIDTHRSDGLAICLACSSYANHIDAELAPEAIAHHVEAVAPRATHPGRGLTLMPLHGLNVWSLVQHNTVVFSKQCLEQLEHRLLTAMRMVSRDKATKEPSLWSPSVFDRGEFEDDADSIEPATNRHFPEPPESVHWKKITLS
ncbi:39S ribosomal protein L4 mitochondrial [Fasciola gigantica]|uniref:Large ribosomal subunit protein uL4m n=1 Tax=Fasciola gigantica TaxID=46835 RepID=A0A504YKR0_FASGI|nr:39S ribosomal protein L4 mitochondrial [Fasciola gigantica]